MIKKSCFFLAWYGMAWHGMAWHNIAWHGRNWHKSFKGPYCGDESPTRKTMSPLLSNIMLYKITLGIILRGDYLILLGDSRASEGS